MVVGIGQGAREARRSDGCSPTVGARRAASTPLPSHLSSPMPIVSVNSLRQMSSWNIFTYNMHAFSRFFKRRVDFFSFKYKYLEIAGITSVKRKWLRFHSQTLSIMSDIKGLRCDNLAGLEFTIHCTGLELTEILCLPSVPLLSSCPYSAFPSARQYCSQPHREDTFYLLNENFSLNNSI